MVVIYFPLYVFREASRQRGQRRLAVGLPSLWTAQAATAWAQRIVECQGIQSLGRAELARAVSVDSFPPLAGSDVVC